MIKYQNVLIYFSGDTAIGPHFKEINEMFGRGPDLFIVGIGPQKPYELMRTAHLDGIQAMDMANNYLKPVKITPMHFGTFPLGIKADKSDIEVMLEAADNKEDILILEVGGRLDWDGKEFKKAIYE